MLTGVQPFADTAPGCLMVDKMRAQTPDPHALRSGLSPGVVGLTRRLLAAERGQRPESYSEVIALCGRLRDQSLAPQPTVALGRQPKLSAMTAGSVLLCTIVIAGVLLIDYDERPTGFPGSGEPPPEAVGAPPTSPPSVAEVQFESQGEALDLGSLDGPDVRLRSERRPGHLDGRGRGRRHQCDGVRAQGPQARPGAMAHRR